MCAELCLKILGLSLILGQVTLTAAATSTTVRQLQHWCAAALIAALFGSKLHMKWPSGYD